MERRNWWIEIPQMHSMFNFKWQPVSNGIKFDRLGPNRVTVDGHNIQGPSIGAASIKT